MKLLLFLCLIVVVKKVLGEEQQVNLCGRELAQARVLLCFGSEYLYKRSPNQLSESEPRESGMKLGSWVWGGRRDALGARWARHKRGLVDECCLKPCSTQVIRQYC